MKPIDHYVEAIKKAVDGFLPKPPELDPAFGRGQILLGQAAGLAPRIKNASDEEIINLASEGYLAMSHGLNEFVEHLDDEGVTGWLQTIEQNYQPLNDFYEMRIWEHIDKYEVVSKLGFQALFYRGINEGRITAAFGMVKQLRDPRMAGLLYSMIGGPQPIPRISNSTFTQSIYQLDTTRSHWTTIGNVFGDFDPTEAVGNELQIIRNAQARKLLNEGMLSAIKARSLARQDNATPKEIEEHFYVPLQTIMTLRPVHVQVIHKALQGKKLDISPSGDDEA